MRAEFGLRQLLRREDWRNVRARRGAIEWLRGAKFSFAQSDTRFRIELRSRRKIEIELESGELVGGPVPELDDDALPPGVVAALTGGPDATGEPEYTDEQIAAMIERLTRGETLTIEEAQAAWDALQAGDFPVPESLQKALAAILGIEDSALPPVAAVDELQDGMAEAELLGAGNSSEFGLAVPPPNPADPVDYMAWYNEMTRSDRSPAASIYAAAAAAVTDWPQDEGERQLFDAAMRGDAEALASPIVKQWLADSAQAIELARAGNGFEYHGTASESTDGRLLSILLPNVGKMRQIGRAMVLSGREAEASGDYSAAADQYLQTLQLGAQTSQANTLIENLVGIAIQSVGSDALLDTMQHDEGVDYAALAARLESEYAPTRPVSETFQFERAMVLDLVQSGYEYDPEANTYRVSETGVRHLTEAMSMGGENPPVMGDVAIGMYLGAVGFENLNQTVNQHYDRLSAAAAAPYAEGQQQMKELEAEIENPIWRATNPLLSQLLPALSRATQLSHRSESQRRAAFTGRDFAVDPLSGQHFVYRRDGDNFSLYSVGLNGTDEGGVHDTKRNENDIVIWPRPPKK
ncbi:MAG: hypothetical protein HZB38_17850 [Planctomycetes bacterium]|nr:hypothetical protein [Planctomycetota bacterium]